MVSALQENKLAMTYSQLIGDKYFVAKYSHYDHPAGNFEVSLYSLAEGSLQWKCRLTTASAPLLSTSLSEQELVLTGTCVKGSVFKIHIRTLAISSGETVAETCLEVPDIRFEINVNSCGRLLTCTLNTLNQERIGVLVDLHSHTIVQAFPTGDSFLVSACRASDTSFALLLKKGTLIKLIDSTDCTTVRDQTDDSKLYGCFTGGYQSTFLTPEYLYYVNQDSMRIESFKHGLDLTREMYCLLDLSDSGRYVSVIASGIGTQRIGIIDLIEKKLVFSKDIHRRYYQAVDPDHNRICYLRSVFCKLALDFRDFDDKRVQTIALP